MSCLESRADLAGADLPSAPVLAFVLETDLDAAIKRPPGGRRVDRSGIRLAFTDNH